MQFDATRLGPKLRKEKPFSGIVELEGKQLYQVYAPVAVNGQKIGTLLVTRPLHETDRLVRQTAGLGVITIAIVGLALFYALYANYRRKKELIRMANRHSATGLPNRRKLNEVINAGENRGSAFFLIHIYGINSINRTYGHRFVEDLFQDLVFQLRRASQEQYEFFHFADDRLALLIPDKSETTELFASAEVLTAASLKLFAERGLRGQLQTGIAIVRIEQDRYTAEQLFADAAIALLNHRKDSALPYSLYSPDMRDKLQRKTIIAEELRLFLHGGVQNTLLVEYQPIVDLQTNQVVSFEALTRMKLPRLGPISPLDFIAVAEREHLIGGLDLW